MTEKFKQSQLSDHIGDIEYQDKVTQSIEATIARAHSHVVQMHMIESQTMNVFCRCFLPITDSNYLPPTKAQVQAVVDLIISRGYTKTDISLNLGITTERNRTLTYWLTDSRDTNIPHSAWVHLTALAGLVLPTMLERRE